MRTEKEIKTKIAEDTQFIVSAVTTQLHDMAYLNYFTAWENNGGMGWFFTECVEITHEVMFRDGSAYLKWLDHWKETEGNNWEAFSEFTGETCFDWYHMNEAKKVFESRYEKDDCTKEQISEHIGYIINSFESEVDRADVIDRGIKFARKQREVKVRREQELLERKKLELENKKKAYDKIIKELKELEVDGEMMQYIIEGTNMNDQMLRQLILSNPQADTIDLLDEHIKLSDESLK
jgi:hypothetical protein